MSVQLNYEAAMANRGNWERLKKAIRRAEGGEKLTVGFLGGSITQGCLATGPDRCYAYRVFTWWQNRFPNAEFQYVNAGIGATDSQFGCARAEEDLLAYDPDVVIVEYSVNDAATPHYMETYEGVVRKILNYKTAPAVILVHNVCYDNGGNAQLIHGKVARYYDLPSVSMQSCIYPELVSGRLENRMITTDDLHPNDYGHELVASVITWFLDKVYEEKEAQESTYRLPEQTLTVNAYEHTRRYQNHNSQPQCTGFVPDTEKQEHITDIFKKGWTAAQKDASIRFTVEGSCIGVQYRKTISKPAPIAHLYLDNDREHPFVLDGNFDETWGDKLVLDTILEHGEKKTHTVEIRIVETHEEDRLPFYLVSIIAD